MALKNKDDRFVKCIDCTHAKFMQWYNNPIIAECDTFKERMVAESRRICKSFIPSAVSNPEVTHYSSYDD